MAAPRLIPNYTYDDFCQWKGRWELIDGIPFAITSSRDTRHQCITPQILFSIVTAIKKSKTKDWEVCTSIPLLINVRTILFPDVAIFSGTPKEEYLDYPPLLIVEVLAADTIKKDRVAKFEIYQDFGVKYYLIADRETCSTEVFILQNGSYQKASESNPTRFELGKDCSIYLDLNSIWD